MDERKPLWYYYDLLEISPRRDGNEVLSLKNTKMLPIQKRKKKKKKKENKDANKLVPFCLFIYNSLVHQL